MPNDNYKPLLEGFFKFLFKDLSGFLGFSTFLVPCIKLLTTAGGTVCLLKSRMLLAESVYSNYVFFRGEKKQWIPTMFLGCATVYAARTAMPLCALAMSNEFHWDKKQAVSARVNLYRIGAFAIL